MRVLMLGWEFPPFIAGGLGTACQGLTRALNAIGQDILFVLPRPIGDGKSEHVTLMGPDAIAEVVANPVAPTKPHVRAGAAAGSPPGGAPAEEGAPVPVPGVVGPLATWIRREARAVPADGLGRTRMLEIGATFRSPYGDGAAVGGSEGSALGSFVESLAGDRDAASGDGRGARGGGVAGGALGSGSWLEGLASGRAEDLHEVIGSIRAMSADSNQYGTDLVGDADRYARIVAALAMKTDFDVVHAHDWLTYPAGLAVKALTGKPLVCHMHATEFDRSGEHINQAVYDIERAGVTGADRVIAVSQLTRTILVHRYGALPSKVDVIYNGVETKAPIENGVGIKKDDKIVLFLGRITMQKGPEYFIRAAKRALEKIDNVKFVVAGSGDMAVRMIEEAAALGIGHKVLFTGFLRGKDVQRVFRMADCYVMPSVSEPFGIAPLEAMAEGTPVIISKQSGVSEVLSHALKVDFWDVDDMANKIVAVLKYPPLSQTLRQHGSFEVRGLTWEGAAEKTVRTYGAAIAGT